MLVAWVGVSEGRQKALVEAGQPVPKIAKIRALVDTGASCTCVDPEVLTGALGLTATGSTPVVTAGGVPEDRDEYDVALAIPSNTSAEAPMVFGTIRVVATPLRSAQGFDALIGRDVLQHCALFYNGSVATFTLAY